MHATPEASAAAIAATNGAQQKLSALQVHPKVAIPVFAGSFVTVLIGVMKQHGLDLSGYAPDLVIMVMGVMGYITPSA